MSNPRSVKKRLGIMLGLSLACGIVAEARPAAAQTSPLASGEIGKHIQIGRLRCAVAPSVGFVVGSRQEMQCELRTGGIPGQLTGLYRGVIKRFGIDLGVTGAGILIWEVFTVTKNVGPGDLAGEYVGASADVAFALGLGANVLVGGSNRSVALHPSSVEGMTGVDLAVGVADLTLTPVTQ
jgi:hypothetical protein